MNPTPSIRSAWWAVPLALLFVVVATACLPKAADPPPNRAAPAPVPPPRPTQILVEGQTDLCAGGMPVFVATRVAPDGTRTDVSNRVTWTSSDTSVLRFPPRSPGSSQPLAVTGGFATVRATLDGVAGELATRVNGSFDGLVMASANPLYVPVGGPRELQLSASFTSRCGTTTMDPARFADWRTDDRRLEVFPSADSVYAQRSAPSVTAGTAATFTASLGARSATTAVRLATFRDVVLTPAGPELSLGLGASRTITGTGVVTWGGVDVTVPINDLLGITSGRPADVATSFSAGGVSMNAVGSSPATVTVTVVHPAGSTAYTVRTGDQVVVRGPASLTAGSVGSYTAIRYAAGAITDVTATATWSSSDSSRLTLADGGAVSKEALAVNGDGATLQATIDGVTGTLAVTTTGSLQSLVTGSGEPLYTPPGPLRAVTAEGTFATSTGTVTADVARFATWTTTDAGVVRPFFFAGQVLADTTGASVGQSATLTAALGGRNADTLVTVVTLSDIQLNPAGPSLTVLTGSSKVITATATIGRPVGGGVEVFTPGVDISDMLGGVASGPSVTTEPTDAGLRVAAVGSSTTALTVTWPGGSQAITVLPASVQVSGGNRLNAGDLTAYTATLTRSDTTTVDVSDQVTWSTSDPAVIRFPTVAVTSGPYQALSVAIGSATVRATLDGVTSTLPVDVVDGYLTGLSIDGSRPRYVPPGAGRSLTVTANFSLTPVDATAYVTWTSADTSVATVTPQSDGSARAVAAGDAEGRSAGVTAALGTRTDSLTIRVAAVRGVAISPDVESLLLLQGDGVIFTASGVVTWQGVDETIDVSDAVVAANPGACAGVVAVLRTARGLVTSTDGRGFCDLVVDAFGTQRTYDVHVLFWI